MAKPKKRKCDHCGKPETDSEQLREIDQIIKHQDVTREDQLHLCMNCYRNLFTVTGH